MIKNIFLDAGGVILDEKKFDNNSAEIITEIVKNFRNYSIKNYWKDVDEAVYRYVPKVYDYILYKYIIDIEKFLIAKSEYKNRIKEKTKFELKNGINDFLIHFSENYKIGIIGQYGVELIKFLEIKNLLKYFTYKEVQDDYKTTKPDPRYFSQILEKWKCNTEESVMVGDRIDKDIIPAKMIGMKTIRMKTGIHKNQEPRVPEEMADITVKMLEEIKIEKIKDL